MQKIRAKQADLVVVFKTKGFTSNFTFNTTKHYYQPYRNYLLKMGRIDKVQAVFEQLTLRDIKKWSSTVLKNFNNCTIIMTNSSCKIRIS